MHFNKKLADFAISKMKHGKQPISKEKADELLKHYNITLDNNELLDYVYVVNMGNNDFMGSSISDEKHLAIYVVFNRWYADTVRLGIPIEWEDML